MAQDLEPAVSAKKNHRDTWLITVLVVLVVVKLVSLVMGAMGIV